MHACGCRDRTAAAQEALQKGLALLAEQTTALLVSWCTCKLGDIARCYSKITQGTKLLGRQGKVGGLPETDHEMPMSSKLPKQMFQIQTARPPKGFALQVQYECFACVSPHTHSGVSKTTYFAGRAR